MQLFEDHLKNVQVPLYLLNSILLMSCVKMTTFVTVKFFENKLEKSDMRSFSPEGLYNSAANSHPSKACTLSCTGAVTHRVHPPSLRQDDRKLSPQVFLTFPFLPLGHYQTHTPLPTTYLQMDRKTQNWHISSLPVSPSGPWGVGHHCLLLAFPQQPQAPLSDLKEWFLLFVWFLED